VPYIRQGEAAGLSQHVNVHREGKAGRLTYALHKAIDGVCGERSAALGRA
jgi:hypothetical protein